MNTKRTLMAVDGNSLAHRAYHALAASGLRDSNGRPSWAIKGFISLLLGAVDRIGPDAIVIGFDDSGNSRRKAALPVYKAQRSEKHEDLRTQLAAIPQVLAQAGLLVVVPPGLEADDVTATAGRLAGQAGWHCTIVTSDRDAFAHISDTTSVLRVINGGIENSPILTPDRFRTMHDIDPAQYLDYAALRGDTSDNLPGVRGIGEKTAAKLLAGMGTMHAVWEDLAAGGEKVAEVAGKACVTRLRADGAFEAWKTNRGIMSAAFDFELGFDFTDRTSRGHLPVDGNALAAALMSYDLRTLVNAARMRLAAPSGVNAQAGAPVPVVREPEQMPTPAAPEGYGWTPMPEEPPFDPEYDLAPAAPAAVSSPGPLHPAAYLTGF